MKKPICTLLALVLCLSLAACGGDTPDETVKDTKEQAADTTTKAGNTDGTPDETIADSTTSEEPITTDPPVTYLTPSEGLEFELNDDGESYSVVGIGSCTDTVLVIPESYNNLPVTDIGKGAFEYCSSFTGVIIPDSVTSLGYDAFNGCTGLTDVTIGKNVTSIAGAFIDCTGLTSITIPDSVTSISGAFYGCTALTSIAIPDGLTMIGNYTFDACTALERVSIPGSVTYFGLYAFYKCPVLTSIDYSGTKAEWEAIEKGDFWDEDTPSYTVHCADGDIAKS